MTPHQCRGCSHYMAIGTCAIYLLPISQITECKFRGEVE